jgi:hypothetical protein
MMKRTVIRKKIKRAFEDTEFSQPDVAEMDDDDSWLRRNDDFVRMSAKSYVSILTISPGEIPNARQDFRVARKRIRGANEIPLVSYPDSAVFALVCLLFFEHITIYS